MKKIFTKPCTAGLEAQLKAEEAEEAAATATATACYGRCSMHSEIPVVTRLESDFPLRNDIFPCPACGEIFWKPKNLEQHQILKHTVSEHIDGEIFQKPHSLEQHQAVSELGDSGNNIVRIIFKTGWIDTEKTPKIHRILKIHNSTKILGRFEEYREHVKSKEARNSGVRRRDEFLRFHCSTFLCKLGQNGNSGLCNHQYCSICGIIRGGFSQKLDGISMLSTSWRAHATIPDDIEDEFRFMNVKKAMLVCRVVAGRVGSDQDDVDKEDDGFDSIVGRTNIGSGGGSLRRMMDDKELLVFNPRSVLPCLVIVYSV